MYGELNFTHAFGKKRQENLVDKKNAPPKTLDILENKLYHMVITALTISISGCFGVRNRNKGRGC